MSLVPQGELYFGLLSIAPTVGGIQLPNHLTIDLLGHLSCLCKVSDTPVSYLYFTYARPSELVLEFNQVEP